MTVEAARPVKEAVNEAESRRLRREAGRRWTVFGVAAVAAFAADQITKLVARATIDVGERVKVFPGLQFVRGRNEGIAFGLFPGRPGLVAVLTVIALLAITVALGRVARHSTSAAIGGGILIGGSVGNLVDRLVHGGVTDFIHPEHWWTFNVADVAIGVGAALVALGLLRAQAAGESDTVE